MSEPLKKANVSRIGIRLQYDGDGNFFSIPLKNNAEGDDKEDSEYGTPIASEKGTTDNMAEEGEKAEQD